MEMIKFPSTPSASSMMRIHPQLKVLILFFLYFASTLTVSADPLRGLESIGYHADTIIDGINYDASCEWNGFDMWDEDIYELAKKDGGFKVRLCYGTDGLSGSVSIRPYVTFDEWLECRHQCGANSTHTDPMTAKVVYITSFRDCTGITSVSIPETVYNCNEYAFAGCTNLKSVYYPSSLIYIQTGMFQGCTSLQSFTIPETVTDIGSSAFEGCTSLQSITIPESVNTIWGSAFAGCTSLKSVNWLSSVSYIPGGMFKGCTSLQSFTIPETVQSIGYSAFEGCTSLQSITIPGSVQEVNSGAFRNCEGLTEIYWNAIDCTGYDVFASCNNLSHIIIGSEVDSIGYRNGYGSGDMFRGAEPERVTCYAIVPPTIDSDCFSYNTYKNAVLYVPAESVDAYRNANGWKRFINIVPIGANPGDDGLLGDVNNDGLNDVQDVVLMMEYVLNGQAEAFNPNNADVNDDQLIDITDVVSLIDKVLYSK